MLVASSALCVYLGSLLVDLLLAAEKSLPVVQKFAERAAPILIRITYRTGWSLLHLLKLLGEYLAGCVVIIGSHLAEWVDRYYEYHQTTGSSACKPVVLSAPIMMAAPLPLAPQPGCFVLLQQLRTAQLDEYLLVKHVDGPEWVALTTEDAPPHNFKYVLLSLVDAPLNAGGYVMVDGHDDQRGPNPALGRLGVVNYICHPDTLQVWAPDVSLMTDVGAEGADLHQRVVASRAAGTGDYLPVVDRRGLPAARCGPPGHHVLPMAAGAVVPYAVPADGRGLGAPGGGSHGLPASG